MTVEVAAFVLAAGAIIAAVVAWVGQPLWRGVPATNSPDPRAVALLVQREAALANLRDIDADHADGRIGDGDYEWLRADALAQGAAALAALDGIEAEAVARSADLVAAIEAEVAARRGRAPDAGWPTVGRGVKCPACGEVAAPGHRYCASCGSPLAGAAPEDR